MEPVKILYKNELETMLEVSVWRKGWKHFIDCPSIKKDIL